MTAPAPAPHTRLVIGGAPAGHVALLAHGPARLTLRADLPAVVPDVTHALHGYLSATSAGGWTLTVRATARIDVDGAARLCTGAALDVGPGQRAHPHPVPGGMLWWLPQEQVLIQRDDTRCEVTLAGHLDRVREWAVRLARQLVTAQLVHAGAVHAHAAAFTYDGGGVLVTGPAGAGKTTLLLAGLRATGGRFVANDRVLLRPDSAGVTAYAWPAPLRVAPGTLQALGGLGTPERAHEEQKIDLDPVRLTGHAGSGITGSARLRLMLWPVRTHRPDPPELVAADEVRATLVRTRLFLHDLGTGRSSHLNHWLAALPGSGALDRARDAVVERLGALRCVRLAVSDDPDLLARHVHDILTSARADEVESISAASQDRP